MYDCDGNKYYDYLAAYSAVNQGHCHPRLVATMQQQCAQLTLTSRAFYNDKLGLFEQRLVQAVGASVAGGAEQARVLPMNTGVEAAETALKLARRWGYDVKGIAPDAALLVFATGNFMGRSIAAVSASDDPSSYGGFGPLLGGIKRVPYDDLSALEALFAADGDRIASFMLEPIQGEAGVVVPSPGYLTAVRRLCDKYRVLMVADEVQTGLCRTGAMLAVDHERVQPDILVLGKALSGGMMPVSAAVARSEIMLTIKPGQHGSTYGGNPLACAVACTALDVLQEEQLAANAAARGAEVRARLQQLVAAFPGMLEGARGQGLLNALIVRPDARDNADGKAVTAWQVCMALKDAAVHTGSGVGVLAKPTRGNIIRLAPPLTLTPQQVSESMDVVQAVLEKVAAGKVPQVAEH